MMKLPHSTLASYSIGYGLSVLLTLIAFSAASYLGALAPVVIVFAAILQLIVQLVFFLHLGKDREGRTDAFLFAFAVLIIGILIVGTLWIMANLDPLHMHSSSPSDLYEDGMVSPSRELH